ncbi:hypothetical protein ABQE06_21505, partial [Enterococcus avium]
MYRFMSILKRDTLNLFLNPMWVILCIAFPFLFTTIGMATLFLTKIIRCCECCGVMAPIAL